MKTPDRTSEYIHRALRMIQGKEARTPKTPHARFSIVVCSNDDEKFNQLNENLKRVFSPAVQVIRIPDAHSLAEGYNRGLRAADGDICIFCHDDVEFLSDNIEALISEDLENADIVGVAGTTRLVGPSWITAGQPHIHGMVGHRQSNHGYVLSSYGLGRDPDVVENITALDGLFLALRKHVADNMAFDEIVFDDFHLYDLDYTYNAYRRGYKLVVDHRIHLIHDSSGRYDHTWHKYAQRFTRKYAELIHCGECQTSPLFKNLFSTSKEALLHAMKRQLQDLRISLSNRPDAFAAGTHVNLSGISGNDGLSLMGNSVNYLYVGDALQLASDKVKWMNEFHRVCQNGAIVELNMRWPIQQYPDQHNAWPYHSFFCFDTNQPGYLKFGRKKGFAGAFVLQKLRVVNEENQRRLQAIYQTIKSDVDGQSMAPISNDSKTISQNRRPQATRPPKFTIIIPHYQGVIDPKTFRRGVDSLLGQTCQDFEILCYHDGPLLEPQTDTKVSIHPTPRRFNDWGHSLRDIGINQANGEYILFFNPDNVMYPNLLETLSQGTKDILVFPIKMMGAQKVGSVLFYETPRNYLNSAVLTGNPVVYGQIDCMQFVMRRERWLEAGGWFDKRQNSDGYLYNLFAEEFDVEYLGDKPLAEHW